MPANTLKVAVAVLATAVAAVAAPVPKAPPGQFYLTCSDGIHAVTPEGKVKDPLPPLRAKNFWAKAACVSPDGKWVAYTATMVRDGHEGCDREVVVRKLADKDGDTLLTYRKYGDALGWVGGTFFYRGGDEYGDGKPEPQGHYVTVTMKVFAYDTATEKTAEYDVPEDHLPLHLLADGKAILTETWDIDGKTATGTLCRVTLATGKVTELCDLGKETFGGYRKPWAVSPDGGRVAGIWTKGEKLNVQGKGKVRPFGEASAGPDGKLTTTPVLLDAATGKRTEWKVKYEENSFGEFWAWSPDGKRVARVETRPHARQNDDPPNKPETWDYVITVCDADGTGAKPVATVEGGHLFGFDWR